MVISERKCPVTCKINSKIQHAYKMSDKIDVKKVAGLARLKLQENEEAYFEDKFNAIMDYVGTISEVEITSEMKEKDESLQQVYRPDKRRTLLYARTGFQNMLTINFLRFQK